MLINLLLSYYIWQISVVCIFLFIVKIVLQIKCNINIQYFKVAKWFYVRIGECFSAMFATIKKIRDNAK